MSMEKALDAKLMYAAGIAAGALLMLAGPLSASADVVGNWNNGAWRGDGAIARDVVRTTVRDDVRSFNRFNTLPVRPVVAPVAAVPVVAVAPLPIVRPCNFNPCNRIGGFNNNCFRDNNRWNNNRWDNHRGNNRWDRNDNFGRNNCR